ncbi:MAG: hypothetical protein ACRDV1_10560 [Actinomycetes bacterium]
MASIVLAHSPLTGPAAWGRLPQVLHVRGHRVVVLDVTDDDEPPYAARYVARAALQIDAAGVDGPAVLAGHSGAGYLLPQLGATQRAARRGVRGYVFVDAGIPHGRGATRLTLLRTEDPAMAEQLEAMLGDGRRFPEWTAPDLRHLVPDDGERAALVASLRPRGHDFFTEPMPFPVDWPDAPCGYVRLSTAYDVPARVSRSRGWPGVERDAGHFGACADPAGVADDIETVMAQL